ncbi:MAG: hypothetical protein WBC85_08625 [Planktotalea sp.]|uniref:hypothetical protein n=1 Tax=Planktotalea sp. TaxID=2029877 RepID=UPI003C75E0E7
MKRRQVLTVVFVAAILAGAWVFMRSSQESVIEISPIDLSVDASDTQYSDLKLEWERLTVESYVVRAAQQIWATWPLADQIWTAADYRNINVLFAETNGENAWLVMPDGNIVKFRAEDLPSAYRVTGYPFRFTSSEQTLNGIPTIKVEVDSDLFGGSYRSSEFESLPTSTMLLAFTAHEEFHRVQNTWNVEHADQGKLIEIGQENFDARSQRYEIIRALSLALLSPEDETEYLEAAKWWFEAYQNDHPQEYELAKSMDIFEGAARYFDMAMNVRSVGGFDLSAEELRANYQRMILKDYTLDADRFFGLPDEESYEIGGIAGVLLEMKNDATWKDRVEQGTPPLEILLENYSASPQEPSPEVMNLVEEIRHIRSQSDK